MESGSEASIEVIAVGVPGGTLAVEHVTAATSPVLAIHGISSQRKLWNWLRAQRPGLSLIAPDLRGRGDSVGVNGARVAGLAGNAAIAGELGVKLLGAVA